jgi:hypothetical protein
MGDVETSRALLEERKQTLQRQQDFVNTYNADANLQKTLNYETYAFEVY